MKNDLKMFGLFVATSNVELALQNNNFQFKSTKKISKDFLTSLQKNDIFSVHCRDFVEYLGFKRCDKHFRAKFNELLTIFNLEYIITSSPITEWRLNFIYNTEQEIINYDKEKIPYGKKTYEEFWNDIAKEIGMTNKELMQQRIDSLKNISCVSIDKNQKLRAGFNSGCWLVVLKK